MQEFYTLVTNIGGAAIANATILGKKVNITEFVVGDGNGSYYTPNADMKKLKNEVWRGKPTNVKIDEKNANVMVVSTVIPAEIGGFTIREMGLVAEDGKLIAISNCPDVQKVTLNTGVASELELTMQIAVSNVETIEFNIDPTIIIATKKDIEELKEELESPQFDDSGTADGIASFTDFMNSIKSKMNIFQFFRNFKAGMKFVMHAGQAVNNTATTEPGFFLDGRVGKFLQDQIDEQNKNMGECEQVSFFTQYPRDWLGKKWETTFRKVFITSNFEYAPPTKDEGNNLAWWNVMTFGIPDRCTQIAVYGFDIYTSNHTYIRRQHDNNVSDWVPFITDSDVSYEDYSNVQHPEPKSEITFFNNWEANPSFPYTFGEGFILKGRDKNWMSAYYQVSDASLEPKAYISKYDVHSKTFDWHKLITDSDIIQQEITINYQSNINQVYYFDISETVTKLLSFRIQMVDQSWECTINHCCPRLNNNKLEIDFKADIKQKYICVATYLK